MKLFRNRKVLLISIVLIINTLIIGGFLTVHAILEQRVTYEMFSDTEKPGVYKIETIEDYLKFADTVSKGNTYKNCEIVLMNDLDFQNVEEVPENTKFNIELKIKKLIINDRLYDMPEFVEAIPKGSGTIFAIKIPEKKIKKVENFTVSFFILEYNIAGTSYNSIYSTNDYTKEL